MASWTFKVAEAAVGGMTLTDLAVGGHGKVIRNGDQEWLGLGGSSATGSSALTGKNGSWLGVVIS